MATKRATTSTATTTTARRRIKVAANVRAFYSKAEYVTPRVALDKRTAAALRRYMKRKGVGVSDAIRAAILAAGGTARNIRAR